MNTQRIYLVVITAGREEECEVPVYAFPTEQMAEQCATMLNEDEERKRKEDREYRPRTFEVSDRYYGGIPVFDHAPGLEEIERIEQEDI